MKFAIAMILAALTVWRRLFPAWDQCGDNQ